jgi:hypothetical protein
LTIAISIKINDGIVLASDSASTIFGPDSAGQLAVRSVYNNANKVFNLRKDFPIGAISWGAGSIGRASVSTIMKDLRQRFRGGSSSHPHWELKENAYTVEQVAQHLKEFVFDELYSPTFTGSVSRKPDLGFIVAGYSTLHAPMADEFQIDINNGACTGPTRIRAPEEIGMTAGGDTEALNRLMNGTAGELPRALQDVFRVPLEQSTAAMDLLQRMLRVPLIEPAMPLQDAIDLAEFLVDLTIRFSRFTPGPPTVGGPIEIAAISKHEGFRWIKRKYYFDRQLNPREEFTRMGHKGTEE